MSGIRQLRAKKLLSGLKKVEPEFCEGCVLGKQKAVSFQLGRHEKKTQKLELMHTDIWEPAHVESLSGKRYFVSFIDDATRKIWIYALREKSEVFEIFKAWKIMVEKDISCQIKALKSDNGGEYTSLEFARFLTEAGIHGIKTIPRTPQENGVAERMNRTILERARCMCMYAGFPLQIWAVIVEAAFLINRSPSSGVDGQIPQELWSGKPVNFEVLRTYGCIAYSLINKEDMKKLDAKSSKCALVGYGGDEYGYKLWDWTSNKVIRSRNVVFNEDMLYKDHKDAKEIPTQTLHADLDTEPTENNHENAGEEIGEPEPVGVDESEPVSNGEPEPVGEPAEEAPTALRRSTRERRPKMVYDPSANSVYNCVMYTDSGEPETHERR